MKTQDTKFLKLYLIRLIFNTRLLHLSLTMTQDLLTKHEGERSYVKNLASRKTEEYSRAVVIKRIPQGPLDGARRGHLSACYRDFLDTKP